MELERIFDQGGLERMHVQMYCRQRLEVVDVHPGVDGVPEIMQPPDLGTCSHEIINVSLLCRQGHARKCR
jgi:hypothetical protein